VGGQEVSISPSRHEQSRAEAVPCLADRLAVRELGNMKRKKQCYKPLPRQKKKRVMQSAFSNESSKKKKQGKQKQNRDR
jgi:hypothetical protein